jgi:hypothetical protein
VAAVGCLCASTDAAGDFFYSGAIVFWYRIFGSVAADNLLFAMQKMFHVLIFGAFGMLSGAGWSTAPGRRRFAAGILISIAAEMAQLLTANRTPSWMDGVLNVACFTGGAALAQNRGAREPDA